MTVAAVACALVFLFCFDVNKFQADLKLYFYNADKTNIVSEARQIKYDKTEEIIPAVIKELSKRSSQGDKISVINKGTKINEIIFDASESITIDFNEKFLGEDVQKNLLAVYAVIKSVCAANAITGINYVKITVDGEDIKTADGKIIDYLSFDDIKFSDDAEGEKEIELALYFADNDMLKKELRNITSSLPPEQCVIEELLKGPEDNSLSKIVSGEAASVETIDGICFVNFKFSFVEKNTFDKTKAKLAVYSIVNSLTELSHIQGVQILIDGKKTEKIGDVKTDCVLHRNESLIH